MSPPTRRSSKRRSATAATMTADFAALVGEGEPTRHADLYEHLAIHGHPGARPTLCARSTIGWMARTALPASKSRRFSRIDPQATIDEARRLWAAVDRPNLMVKVPGTAGRRAGGPRTDRRRGINVNITLLFSIDMYKAVARSFHRGSRGAAARRARTIDASPRSRASSSAASTPDRRGDRRAGEGGDAGSRGAEGAARQGRDRQRQARLSILSELIASDRWQALAAKGARPQRLLWASTGTKDAAYSDVLYVETLIGPRHDQHHAAQDHRRVSRSWRDQRHR